MNRGRLVGTIDPTADPIADAISRGAKNVAQGALTGVDAYTRGQRANRAEATQKEQFNKALDANKKQAELTRKGQTRDAIVTAINGGAGEEETNVIAKANGFDSAASLFDVQDPVAAAVNGSPVPPAAGPMKTQTPAPTPAGPLATSKGDTVASSVSGVGPPAEKQPPAKDAPDPIAVAINGNVSPVSTLIQSRDKRAAAKRDADALVETTKNDRERIEQLRTKLQSEGFEGYIDRIPGLNQYDISKTAQAEAALGRLVAFKDAQKAAERERLARIQLGKTEFENEGQLRREFGGMVKPYQEVIDNTKDIESLAKQKTASADFGLLQKYARLLSPGIVTETDMKNASKPGGLLEKFEQEINAATNGNPVTDVQRDRIMNAIRSMTANAETRKVELHQQYSILAKDYFGEARVASIVGVAPAGKPVIRKANPKDL